MNDKEKVDYIRVVMLCQPGIKDKLEKMRKEDHRTSSMFLNLLIEQEYERRQNK